MSEIQYYILKNLSKLKVPFVKYGQNFKVPPIIYGAAYKPEQPSTAMMKLPVVASCLGLFNYLLHAIPPPPPHTHTHPQEKKQGLYLGEVEVSAQFSDSFRLSGQ